jgi:hypothetical protein
VVAAPLQTAGSAGGKTAVRRGGGMGARNAERHERGRAPWATTEGERRADGGRMAGGWREDGVSSRERERRSWRGDDGVSGNVARVVVAGSARWCGCDG